MGIILGKCWVQCCTRRRTLQWVAVHWGLLTLILNNISTAKLKWGSGTVGWGTAPQDRRFWVWFPVHCLEIFKWPTPSVRFQFSCGLKWVPGYSFGGKVWLVCWADKSAILLVPNVKVRVEAQCICPLRLHCLLWETFTFDCQSKKEFNTYLSQHELSA